MWQFVSSFPLYIFLIFVIFQLYLLASTTIPFLTHWLFRNVLLNFQMYEDFLVIFLLLLISNLIRL